MKKKNVVSILASLLVLTLATCLSSGCGPTLYAISKHNATKASSIKVEIGENEVPSNNKFVLSKVSVIAIWPDNEGEVQIANNLQESKVFARIITPAHVNKVIYKLNLDRQLSNLTNVEILNAFKAVCDETGSEAMVAFRNIDRKAGRKSWPLNRTTMNIGSRMFLYVLETHQIVYSSVLELQIDMGISPPDPQEILRVSGEILAEKIIEVHGQPSVQKGLVSDLE